MYFGLYYVYNFSDCLQVYVNIVNVFAMDYCSLLWVNMGECKFIVIVFFIESTELRCKCID